MRRLILIVFSFTSISISAITVNNIDNSYSNSVLTSKELYLPAKATYTNPIESWNEMIKSFKTPNDKKQKTADIDATTAINMFTIGLKNEEKGELDGALMAYEKAINLNCTQLIFQYKKADIQQKMKRFDEALETLKTILLIDSTYTLASLLKGDILFQKKNYKKAIEIYSRTISLHPDLEPAYNKRALAYIYDKKLNTALADLTSAIAINNKNPDNYYLRGWAFENIGDTINALADYDKGIMIQPTSALYYQRGNINMNRHEWQSANKDLIKAVKLNPKDIDILISCSKICYFTKDYESSFEYAEKAKELDPRNAEAINMSKSALVYIFMAKANNWNSNLTPQMDLSPSELYALNNSSYSKSSKSYRESIKINNKDKDALIFRANISFKNNDIKNAYEDCKSAFAIDSSHYGANKLLGDIYRDSMKYQVAIKHYQTALKSKPNDALLYYEIGKAFLKIKNGALAIFHLEKALALNPYDKTTYLYLGLAHVEIFQRQKAIAFINEYIKTKSTDEYAYLCRANIYKQLGQIDDAFDDYTIAIGLSPEYYEAYYYRAQLEIQKNRYIEAVEDFTKVLSSKSPFDKAYQRRAEAFEKLKKWDEALADYNSYIQLQPKTIDGFWGIANTYIALNKYDDALRSYNQAISNDRNKVKSYIKKAELLLLMEEYNQVLEVCSHITKIDPFNKEVYYYSGISKKNLNNKLEAYQDLKRAATAGNRSAQKLLDAW